MLANVIIYAPLYNVSEGGLIWGKGDNDLCCRHAMSIAHVMI